MLLGTQRVNERGHLEIGGCDAVELAARFGTPLYVMDEDELRAKCRAYRRAFESRYPDSVILYASKAFTNTAMCRLIDQEGLGIDVASRGELFTAQQAGFPADRIYVHGSNKLPDEIAAALEAGVRCVVADSEPELDQLQAAAASRNIQLDILIRVTPGVAADTHTHIHTGRVDTKFGLGIAGGQALAGMRHALALSHLRLRGLHCHIGSQILEIRPFVEAATILARFLKEARDVLGFEADQLNVGGGPGVRYRSSDQPASVDEFAAAITEALQTQFADHGLRLPQLLLEPGRSIVGEAGTTLYTVGVIKEVPGIRTYVSVDGGLSDNPRPSLYDAVYEAIVANKANAPTNDPVTISGRHCETDTLIKDIDLPEMAPGDILAVQTTGAYNHAMASNYNRFLRPAVVAVSQGQAEIIVERETNEDLTRHDRIPERWTKP
jgi:diaminopimelate decarboxylase